VTTSHFPTIAAAIDGSPQGHAALDAAIDLAQHYGSELTVLAVAPIIPVYVAPAEPLVLGGVPTSDLPRYRELVEAAVKQARAAGVKSVSGVAYEGVVVDEILMHLEKQAPSLVVLGSRGLSTGKRILLGSVSTAVVTHAPCPVLVVRGEVTPKHAK
jgi:nucleotide-binding universal stress UspA family protein